MRAKIDVRVDIPQHGKRIFQLFRKLAVRRDDLFHRLFRLAEMRLFQIEIGPHRTQLVAHGVQRAALAAEAPRAGAIKPLGIDAHPIAGQAGRLADTRNGAHRAQILRFGRFLLRIGLFGNENELIVRGRPLDRGERDSPPYVERDVRIGENHLQPHGNDGKYFCTSCRLHRTLLF